jgi:hypothetical protein
MLRLNLYTFTYHRPSGLEQFPYGFPALGAAKA